MEPWVRSGTYNSTRQSNALNYSPRFVFKIIVTLTLSTHILALVITTCWLGIFRFAIKSKSLG